MDFYNATLKLLKHTFYTVNSLFDASNNNVQKDMHHVHASQDIFVTFSELSWIVPPLSFLTFQIMQIMYCFQQHYVMQIMVMKSHFLFSDIFYDKMANSFDLLILMS